MKKNMAGAKNKKNTVVDLFSGVGGISLGFEKQGFETLFVNDIDKGCYETFIFNNPNTPFILDDIKNLSEDKMKSIIKNKKVDVLVAGVPCQSFSMAGKRIRKGDETKDPRNFLFLEVMRIADILDPKIIIIENVKGILSMANGSIKDEIIDELEKRGYKADYKILNASQHGVPQKRERVFFIANKIDKENIFPKPKKEIMNVGTALENIKGKNHEPRELKGVTLERVKLIKQGKNWMSLPPNLQTKSIHSGAYGRINPSEPSRTLTTRFDTPSVGYVTHPVEDRTLTVREGARIQTFPDSYEFKGNRMSQYKQVGNAVPVTLASEVAKGIKKMLE